MNTEIITIPKGNGLNGTINPSATTLQSVFIRVNGIGGSASYIMLDPKSMKYVDVFYQNCGSGSLNFGTFDDIQEFHEDVERYLSKNNATLCTEGEFTQCYRNVVNAMKI